MTGVALMLSEIFWVHLCGDAGDTHPSPLVGPYLDVSVFGWLLSSPVLQVKGGGIVHLTGFFNREYDPDIEHGKSGRPLLQSGSLLLSRLPMAQPTPCTGIWVARCHLQAVSEVPLPHQSKTRGTWCPISRAIIRFIFLGIVRPLPQGGESAVRLHRWTPVII